MEVYDLNPTLIHVDPPYFMTKEPWDQIEKWEAYNPKSSREAAISFYYRDLFNALLKFMKNKNCTCVLWGSFESVAKYLRVLRDVNVKPAPVPVTVIKTSTHPLFQIPLF